MMSLIDLEPKTLKAGNAFQFCEENQIPFSVKFEHDTFDNKSKRIIRKFYLIAEGFSPLQYRVDFPKKDKDFHDKMRDGLSEQYKYYNERTTTT